jgi:hypoxanthine phosphoribosyltransferase
MIITYQEIENHINKLFLTTNHQYDYIIGMSRGGLIPSVHLSHKFNIPMKIADISHPLSNGDNVSSHKNTVPDITYWNSRLLIIDDILDSGYSIDECLNKLNVEKADVAVLYAKESGIDTIRKNPKLCKLFYAEKLPDDAPFIYFPWEL